MKLLAPLLALLVLSGCLGGDDDPVESAATGGDSAAPVDPSASASAPSSAPSAGAKPAGTPPAAGESASPPPTPVAVDVPYSWTSTLPPEVCVPAAVLGCVGLLARDGWFDIPTFAAAPTRASLTLTWTAEPGGVAEMMFVLVQAHGCEGDGCWTGENILTVVGPSPLVLESELPALAAGEFFVVAARAASMVPDPAFGYAHTEQDFGVEGTFRIVQ